MIKEITLKLTNKQCEDFVNKVLLKSQVFDLCEVKESFGIPLGEDMGNDGTRIIIMNNEKDIVYAIYNCVASFNLYKDFGIDLEVLLHERIRQELGFSKKF